MSLRMVMPKLNLYGTYKTELTIEQYLVLDIIRPFRPVLAKRIGYHDLEIEKVRYENIQKEERKCKIGHLVAIENEYIIYQ